MVIFTKHAREKFNVLKRHRFPTTEKQVLEILRKPDLIDHSRLPLVIAQGEIDKEHVLRVVFKKERSGDLKVITFYPGRKTQYEKRS